MSGITKMTPRIQWDHVSNDYAEEDGVVVVEVAAAPIMDDLSEDIMEKISGAKKAYVFYNGEEKPYGCGEPASNFRSKVSSDVNNKVVNNLKKSFEKLKGVDATVCLSSYPRDDRLFTFKMTGDGMFDITQKGDVDVGDCSVYNRIFQEFLTTSKITYENVKKIRLTSESAGFRTMMADILSMLIQVDVVSGGNITSDKTLSFDVYQPEQTDESGELVLMPMTLPDGKVWTPVEGNDYFYINHQDRADLGVTKVPVTGSNLRIFEGLWKLLNCEENEVKLAVREHFSKINQYHTFRDYCLNDTDDAFTIIAILHAFKFTELSQCEMDIVRQFEVIIKPWYDELGV